MLKPVTYIADADKEVIWCQCKQTKLEHRPFCDGSHKKLAGGPVDRTVEDYIAYDQYDQIVDTAQSVAGRLGLKTNKKGWIVHTDPPQKFKI